MSRERTVKPSDPNPDAVAQQQLARNRELGRAAPLEESSKLRCRDRFEAARGAAGIKWPSGELHELLRGD